MKHSLRQTSVCAFRLQQLPSLLLSTTGLLGLAIALPTVANPIGAQVVAGQAIVSQQGNTLSIANSPNTIINWQDFSIQANEITRFVQQNSDSAVLNRIVGQNPSQIWGALQSNGRVFLINPNGILFGRGSQVNVNGLLASSLNLSDPDFLQGKRQFTGSADAAAVRNEGSIATPRGGQVFLIAPQVENKGIITAPNGDVLLAAGHKVNLVDASNPDVQVLISAPATMAVNLGQVIASGGRIGIYGALVKQSGRVQADSAVVGENGKIIFKASRDTLLDADSQTTARGAGKGGEIQVLGERVALLGQASVDASGQHGGGTVLVGGDYHGNNAAVQNAKRTILDTGATLRADAGSSGAGGKVIVWSDQSTTARGSISARGGSQAGDGGFVEVSGKQSLDFHAKVDMSAPQGRSGTLLLDPAAISLVGGTGDGAASPDGTGTFQGGSNPAGTVLFNDPDITTAGVSNIYQSELEGITPGTHIVLEATDHIGVTGTFVGAQLSLPNNSNLTLRTRNASTDGSGQTGINLTGSVDGANLELRTQGSGSITLQTGTGTSPQSADIVVGKMTTAGGSLTASGTGTVNSNGLLQSNGGNIDFTGANIQWNANVNAGTGTIAATATAAGGSINFSAAASLAVNGATPATGVHLVADNISMGSGSITTSNTQEVRINPTTVGRNLDILSGAKSGNSLELTPAELNQISTGDLVLNALSGTATVGSAFTAANTQRVALFGNAVAIQNSLSVTPPDGSILIGTGALNITATGALATTGALGSITLLSDNMALSGAAGSINAGAGVVALVPNSPSAHIELGAGAISQAGVLGLTPTDLNSVSSGTALLIGKGSFGWGGNTTVLPAGFNLTASVGQLTIQSGSGSGNMAINGPLQYAGQINVFSDGQIAVAPSATIQANNLLLEADKMDLAGAANSINTGSGTTWIRPRSSGSNIDLGSSVNSANATLELSNTELNTVANSGVLRIGRNAASSGVGSYDIQISAPLAFGGSGVLSLQTDGHIGQVTGATVGVNKLALHAMMGVNLGEANGVSQIAASVGDPDYPGNNFKFSSAQALNVATGLDGTSGVATFASGGNYAPLDPNSVITLLSTGALTQSAGALLSGKAVHVEGSRVVLNESNPVGVIAGRSTGTSATDVFHYTSANGIQLSQVDASYGIDHAGASAAGAVTLKSVSGGIGQDANAPIASAGSVHLDTTGPVGLIAATNQVAAVTSQGSSGFAFFSSSTLTVGTGGVSTANGPIDVASGATLVIANPVNAGTGAVQLTGANVEIAAGGNITGNMVGIRADQANSGTIHSTGSFSIGNGTTSAIKLEADNFSFLSGTPTITTNASSGELGFVNASDDRTMVIDANLSGNYLSPNIFFGNNNAADPNTTAAIDIAIAINQGSGLLGFATSGALTQSAAITAQKLVVLAASATLNAGNQVQQVAAQTTGAAGGFALNNNIPLSISSLSTGQATVNGITTNNGAVSIINTGAISIDAPIDSGTGSINVVAHSPLTVNAAVASTSGTITLEAGSTGSTGDILTVNAAGSVSTSGAILLKAGAAINLIGSVSGSPTLQANLNQPLTPVPPVTPVEPTATLSQCIATPTLAGCSTLLPTVAACSTAPTLPGCSVVLPTITTCIATPTLPGCSVVLPTVTSCIATPALPGCSVVLPTVATCIATPTLPGCSVVLPTITACIATPTLPGCAVVLPNLTACIATPTLAGCAVVLPNLAACITTPTLPGCTAVVPSLAACVAAPTLAGCSVVLPTLSQCTSAPTLAGCQVVLPVTQSSTLQSTTQAINDTVNIINLSNNKPALTPVASQPAPTATGSTETAVANSSPTDPKLASSTPKDSKTEEKKDDKKVEKTAVAKDTAAKKDEPVKKLYCN